MIGYLDAFIGGARAVGVIGTEVGVDSALATMFVRHLPSQPRPIMHAIRWIARTIRSSSEPAPWRTASLAGLLSFGWEPIA